MYSAFGVDHGGISKRQSDHRERAEHYGRMSGTTGVLGGAATGVGAGAGVVGALERKGHDPMGFTQRALGEYDTKPLSS